MNATPIHRFAASVGGKAERNQAPETTAKIGADGSHFQERPPPMFSSGKPGPAPDPWPNPEPALQPAPAPHPVHPAHPAQNTHHSRTPEKSASASLPLHTKVYH